MDLAAADRFEGAGSSSSESSEITAFLLAAALRFGGAESESSPWAGLELLADVVSGSLAAFDLCFSITTPMKLSCSPLKEVLGGFSGSETLSVERGLVTSSSVSSF